MKPITNVHPALSILIVEDEKMAHLSMRLIITAKFPGVGVYFAENGRQGLEIFKELLPDIVITDINMPGMDGIEMAGEIRLLKKDTKFIAITGVSNETYLEKFRAIGFSEYMVKPIEFNKLVAAIEKCIDEITQDRR
jgi:YesN/AraC family two-component response regulator